MQTNTLGLLLATDRWWDNGERPLLCFHGSKRVPQAHGEIVDLVRFYNGPAELARIREHWCSLHDAPLRPDGWPRELPTVTFHRLVAAALLDARSGLSLHYVNPRCRLAAA